MTMEEQIRQAAARGYCHPKNSHKEVDVDLLDAICEEIVKLRSPYDDGPNEEYQDLCPYDYDDEPAARRARLERWVRKLAFWRM